MRPPRIASLAPALALVLVSLLLVSTGALAQEEMTGLPQATDLARQSLRPYWHVFAAYAIAIVLIGGWAFSIARRLADVEDRLVD